MPFLTGRVSFLRFCVACDRVAAFTQDHLDKLADRAAGRQRLASADGIEVGWSAGDSVLDTDFTLDKNVFPEHLHFEMRVDTDKLPSDLLKAYTAVELKALAANNPSGIPSARQKREAKEIARERLEQEAKDGRYRKRKCFPVLWDARTNEVLFGATSVANVDRFTTLFEQTFGAKLEAMTAGRVAADATSNQNFNPLPDAAPSAFCIGSASDFAWIADSEDRSWLGNELLLWLWYHTDVISDTLKLGDGSEVALMFARGLTLECPRGMTGADSFAHEGPTRMPEARRAIQAGKLPRKAGLTLARHDQQYEFALHAESFAVAGAKLPAPDDDTTDARGRIEVRFSKVRDLIETLDLVYAVFLAKRLGRGWAEELSAMQKWLRREERAA